MTSIDAGGLGVRLEERWAEHGRVIIAKAPAAGSTGLKLAVYKGFVYTLTKRMFGIQDVQVGDAVFDDRFIIKGNDEPFVVAWLGADVRAAISRADLGRYELRGGTVRARLLVDDDTRERAMPAFIAAVATLARRAEGLAAEWRQTAAALGGHVDGAEWRTDGTFGLEVPVGKRTARADLWRHGRRLHTRLRATLDPGPTLQERMAGVKTIVDRLAPARIDADEHYVTVLARGFERDAERLGRLAELAVILGTDPLERGAGGDGPYR